MGIGFADGDDALPDWGSGFAVVDNVLLPWIGLPGDGCVVGLVEFDFYIGRRILGLGEGCHDGEIGACDSGEVIEIHIVDDVVGGVLAGEFFMDFNESDRIESGVGERGVVTASTESVASENEFDAEVFLGFSDDKFGESGKFSGIVGVGFFGENADSFFVFLPRFVRRGAYSVVAEDGVDNSFLIDSLFGDGSRAVETLFFAGKGDELKGVGVGCVAENAGEFGRDGYTAGVVVSPGGGAI